MNIIYWSIFIKYFSPVILFTMLHVYNGGEVSWSKSPQQTLWALQGEPWPIDATLISKHMLAQTYLLNQLWHPLYKMEIFFM